MKSFLFILTLLSIAVLLMSVGIIIKGKFPDTHVGHNPNMKKKGISCAKHEHFGNMHKTCKKGIKNKSEQNSE